MENGHYMFHEREVVSVSNPQGYGAPEIVEVQTGKSIDFYTGQPFVYATQQKTLEECVREIDSIAW